MHVTVFVLMRTVSMHMGMSVLVTGFVYMRMLMKMLVCMSVSVLVLICHFSLPLSFFLILCIVTKEPHKVKPG